MPSGSDQHSGQQPSPQVNSSEALARQFLQQIVKLLDAGQGPEAAREFVEAQGRGVLPRGEHILQWIIAVIGRDHTAKLVSAFAHYPCFFCKGGLEKCAACAGKGIRPEGPICDTCLGSGYARCEFCDGAGLSAYSFVPAGLQLPVLIDRTAIAVHQLKKLIAHPIPTPDEPLADKRQLQLILNFNKLIGILENSIIAARETHDHGVHIDSVATAIRACHQITAQAHEHLRRILRVLATTIRRHAKAPQISATEAEFINSRADFYDALARSADFEGSPLHHPFLKNAPPQ